MRQIALDLLEDVGAGGDVMEGGSVQVGWGDADLPRYFRQTALVVWMDP